MKKIVPIAMVAFFGLMVFASCKKDYSCTCKVKVPAFSIDSTYKSDLGKKKKKDAESACDKMESDSKAAIEALGGTLDCSL